MDEIIELEKWLAAAYAIRDTCSNKADFDALIAHQQARLVMMWLPLGG
jgi:hypothetical protein